MKIPNNTLSTTMLRTYGTAGFVLEDIEKAQGCPRYFRKKYVEKEVVQGFSYPLVFGSTTHHALQLMDDESIPPDEAVERVFPASLPPEAYTEILDLLNAYLERGATPTDMYATIATEQHLKALLYTDPEHGEIYIQAFIDWLGVDLDDNTVIHAVDYKTNRAPSKEEEVRRDVQMRLYDLIIALNWSRWMKTESPRIVMHLDAIRFRDVPVSYSQEERDIFRSWLISVAKQILADDEGAPRLNPGCANCPVKGSCPEYRKLPDIAKHVVDLKPDGTSDDDMLTWRDRANEFRLLLDKAVKEVDATFFERVKAGQPINSTLYTFEEEPKWVDSVDMRDLHTVVGDDIFYGLVSTSKTALEKLTKDWAPTEKAAVMGTIVRQTDGSKITKTKIKKAKK